MNQKQRVFLQDLLETLGIWWLISKLPIKSKLLKAVLFLGASDGADYVMRPKRYRRRRAQTIEQLKQSWAQIKEAQAKIMAAGREIQLQKQAAAINDKIDAKLAEAQQAYEEGNIDLANELNGELNQLIRDQLTAANEIMRLRKEEWDEETGEGLAEADASEYDALLDLFNEVKRPASEETETLAGRTTILKQSNYEAARNSADVGWAYPDHVQTEADRAAYDESSELRELHLRLAAAKRDGAALEEERLQKEIEKLQS